MAEPELDDFDLGVLRFAATWWRDPGAKEQAIKEQFGIPSVRFYQHLNRVIDLPGAQRADPHLCNRLRRLREKRQVRTNGRPAHWSTSTDTIWGTT